ncbi:MAG: glycoside hydrolase family 1 protein [Candidatus Babeliales bacterium]
MYKKMLSFCLLVFSLSFLTAGDQLVFPEGFLKGVGLSAYQNGGRKTGHSNWSEFEQSFIAINAKTFFGPAIKNNERVGRACGFWDNAFKDIDLIQELGCNTFRFSIEWAEIEPVEGCFNYAMLDFYERFVDELLARGIKPMITLYHFVHPYWFEHKGAFEKEKGISYFVRYCKVVFERLGKKVDLWCTINEPTVSSACGYVLGIHPPGKFGYFKQAGRVLLNLLNAHVSVYKALKKMPGGKEAQIGLVHQLLQFEAYNPEQSSNKFFGSLRNFSGAPLAQFFNFAFAHDVVKRFLATGHFYYEVPGPFSKPIKRCNPDAPRSYDFIGLNYYSRVVFGPGPTNYPGQVMTDMEYPVRPETLYEAIANIAELGVPIYITENGLADAQDAYRAEFIKGYLSMVHKAIQDGYDVRGYYYWTLMDNFEWNDGYSMKFGLYDVDFKSQKRTLRAGALPYRDWFKVAPCA